LHEITLGDVAYNVDVFEIWRDDVVLSDCRLSRVFRSEVTTSADKIRPRKGGFRRAGGADDEAIEVHRRADHRIFAGAVG
jgi:hypothetical protein